MQKIDASSLLVYVGAGIIAGLMAGAVSTRAFANPPTPIDQMVPALPVPIQGNGSPRTVGAGLEWGVPLVTTGAASRGFVPGPDNRTVTGAASRIRGFRHNATDNHSGDYTIFIFGLGTANTVKGPRNQVRSWLSSKVTVGYNVIINVDGAVFNLTGGGINKISAEAVSQPFDGKPRNSASLAAQVPNTPILDIFTKNIPQWNMTFFADVELFAESEVNVIVGPASANSGCSINATMSVNSSP